MAQRRVYGFEGNAHKFYRKDYSGIISFVFEGKEGIHKYIQYEVSMTVHMGRIARSNKSTKMAAI